MSLGNMELLKTPLYDLHIKNSGKMVDFTGYSLPIQYSGMGIIKEHLHVRESVGLFDVSHMGQVIISSANKDPAIYLEKIIPSDLQSLEKGKMRYSVLLNKDGGIIDDLIISRLSDNEFFIVVNAACKKNDIKYLKNQISDDIKIKLLDDRGQIALQGKHSEEILFKLIPEVKNLKFMNLDHFSYLNEKGYVTRTGYTGEDGFEISLPSSVIEKFTKELLKDKRVSLTGLGARDSLRLEAGLTLYGHELSETITPVEAGIKWIIQETRREKANFLGANKILNQIKNGIERKRVGILPNTKAPIRDGVELIDNDGKNVGMVTSGGFSPSLSKPIAMAYLDLACVKGNKKFYALLRGKKIDCEVTKLPFIEHKYKR